MRKALGIALMGIVIVIQLLLVLVLLWSIGWSLLTGAWLSLILWLVFGVSIITIIGGFITLPLIAAAARLLRLDDLEG